MPPTRPSPARHAEGVAGESMSIRPPQTAAWPQGLGSEGCTVDGLHCQWGYGYWRHLRRARRSIGADQGSTHQPTRARRSNPCTAVPTRPAHASHRPVPSHRHRPARTNRSRRTDGLPHALRWPEEASWRTGSGPISPNLEDSSSRSNEMTPWRRSPSSMQRLLSWPTVVSRPSSPPIVCETSSGQSFPANGAGALRPSALPRSRPSNRTPDPFVAAPSAAPVLASSVATEPWRSPRSTLCSTTTATPCTARSPRKPWPTLWAMRPTPAAPSESARGSTRSATRTTATSSHRRRTCPI